MRKHLAECEQFPETESTEKKNAVMKLAFLTGFLLVR
jgi:hypothetical protein